MQVRRLFHWLAFRKRNSFTRELTNLLGYHPYSIDLYETALTHRSLGDQTDQNNERLEYLGDAILSALVADYLFKRYPYKGEGYLTEMRSKMVNRQQLNHIALLMGLKKITRYNKSDASLRLSHIFGNTLEALIGAVYLDAGFETAEKLVHGLFQNVEVNSEMLAASKDPKTELQEWLQDQGTWHSSTRTSTGVFRDLP